MYPKPSRHLILRSFKNVKGVARIKWKGGGVELGMNTVKDDRNP